MEDRQKFLFAACIKQAEYFHSHFDQRRQFEWKVTLGIWTLLVGGIIFVKSPDSVPWWLMALLVFGYVFFWLKRIWEANNFDKEKAKFYQQQANSIMCDTSDSVTSPPWLEKRKWYELDFLFDWSIQFQSLATAVLAILFYVVKR